MEIRNPIIINKYLGLYTSKPASSIPDFYLANSVNMSVSSIGFLSPFKQYSAHGNTSDTNSYIINSQRFRKAIGTEIPIICVEDGSNVKLYWWNSVDSDYDFLLDLTTGLVPSFSGDGFNTATTDQIYFTNKTDGMYEWTGAIGTVLSNTATVITLNSVTGFADAEALGFASGGGDVVVNGTSYTYTGTSGWTLTGLSGLPTFDANEGVGELPTTVVTPVNFSFLTVADGRIWAGLETSIRLYYSQVGVGTNWTAGNNPDDPGVRDFVEGSGPIKGLSAIKEYVIVGKDDLIRYYKLDYPTSSSKTMKSEILRQGPDLGVATHFGMINVGNEVIYVSPKGGVRLVGISAESDGFIHEDLTEIIRPTIKDGVFTDCRATYFEPERVMLFAYKNNSDSTRNDRVIAIELYKNDETGQINRAISTMDWTVGGWFHYENELYLGSSFEAYTFKAFDSYTKDGGPTTAIATLKQYNFGDPFKQKKIGYLAVNGYIASGQVIKFELDYDTQGTRAHLTAQFDASEIKYIVQPQLNTIGAFEMGTEPIGGTIDDINELNYFQIFFRLPEGHKPHDLQLTVYGDGMDVNNQEVVGTRFAIEHLAFKVEDARYKVEPNRIKYFTT